MLSNLDKDDPHWADRKWANEMNARRIKRGEPMSRMWVKPDTAAQKKAKYRWFDIYDKPAK